MTTEAVSLEEKLRRERQRLHATGVTQFSHVVTPNMKGGEIRLLVPMRGNLYLQRGFDRSLDCIYDRMVHQHLASSSAKTGVNAGGTGHVVGRDASAIDPQLSPDGQLVAFVVAGDIYVIPAVPASSPPPKPTRLTYGAVQDGQQSITHGLADFVAQEEMDRYRGFWWSPDSEGILLAKVDESRVPPYRIIHQGGGAGGATSSSSSNPGSNGGSSSTAAVGADDNAPTTMFEDHRYPFCGQANPQVELAYCAVPTKEILHGTDEERNETAWHFWEIAQWFAPPREAQEYLARVSWLPDGSACVQWQNRTQTTLVLVRLDLEHGTSKTLHVERSDVWINLHHMFRTLPRAIHPIECDRSGCDTVSSSPTLPHPLPEGSCSFLFASERTGFFHLYLYTYVPGINNDRAVLVRTVSSGEWMVESIAGIDMEKDLVYVMGTYESVLERHLYALSITGGGSTSRSSSSATTADGASPMNIDSDHGGGSSSEAEMEKSPRTALGGGGGPVRRLKNLISGGHNNSSSSSNNNSNDSASSAPPKPTPSSPIRLTMDRGMHSVVMDDDCSIFVDTSSDLGRPTSVKIFQIGNSSQNGRKRCKPEDDIKLKFTLYDAAHPNDEKNTVLGSFANDMMAGPDQWKQLAAPELLSFPTSDGSETLHAALYRPDARIHGPGPYPLICAVYGGPHVQRVNRSWSQCADMRAQRLRSLGFCVIKCDNRGSARRGLGFESAIRRRLGRLEVLDQVTAVRQLVMRGIADASRVGIYGWSYGGYLAAMCLCRAPDVFHVAVAGAPVTSWDGYDTHYTERYMGLPAENTSGYRESSLFSHVPNIRGKLMMVHGLIDENVHFRHTTRLINRLIAAGKDYDLLIFPDERHSPRRLRDRIYMEQRISEYFLNHLKTGSSGGQIQAQSVAGNGSTQPRPVAGHL